MHEKGARTLRMSNLRSTLGWYRPVGEEVRFVSAEERDDFAPRNGKYCIFNTILKHIWSVTERDDFPSRNGQYCIFNVILKQKWSVTERDDFR